MYDTIIIGGGPAGLSAALTLKLHEKSLLWFGPAAGSGKVQKAERIANYPGLPMVTGRALNEAMTAQARAMGLQLTEKTVTAVTRLPDRYMALAENEIYEARTVLLATGAPPAGRIAGEEELLGRGVSYCATCDGFLYKGKTLAVVCAAERFEGEAAYLGELAEKIYLYTPYESRLDAPNMERLPKPVRAVAGTERAEKIVLADGREIAVDGVFLLRDAIAPATLAPGIETDGAHIAVDRRQRTSYAGCFAAGDCTGRPYQIAAAVGEGNTAAHSILEYLSAPGK